MKITKNAMNQNTITMLGQIALALILGGLIGWQREIRGKSAGPRTHALVTAGSTLFTILSMVAFGPNTSQVAAGVVTGIGFLGAGTILHKEDRVVGLTTAAGLWIAAAIGMAIGLKFYLFSTITAILVVFLLMFDDRRLRADANRAKRE